MPLTNHDWWKGRKLVEELSDKRVRCWHCGKGIKIGEPSVVIRKIKDDKLVARFCSHSCQNEYTVQMRAIHDAPVNIS